MNARGLWSMARIKLSKPNAEHDPTKPLRISFSSVLFAKVIKEVRLATDGILSTQLGVYARSD